MTPEDKRKRPARLLQVRPRYATARGAAYVGDALELLKHVPTSSVNAIITSPPYALHFKKKYGSPDQDVCVEW